MKIVSIVGARPQFVKGAVVSQALRAIGGVQEILVHTGQHYDHNMSGLFFSELGIPSPDYHLGIGSGLHGQQTGRMLEGIENVLMAEIPDWVVVYGDTNSTLAGALAAAKLHIPVAHVEAGLRSLNRRMPEEINRILTDHVASLLLAPTRTAVSHLTREGISTDRIKLVGDVMYDAALLLADRAECNSDILKRLGLPSGGYILATVHRAENTDSLLRLRAILKGLLCIAQRLPVVFPVHPRTRKALENGGLWAETVQGLTVIDPVGYLDMVMLEKHCCLIVTDSGGVQKEAFFHQVPCVTLREETEWIELVDAGFNHVVAPKSEGDVFTAIRDCLERVYPTRYPKLYGDGKAAERIAFLLTTWREDGY